MATVTVSHFYNYKIKEKITCLMKMLTDKEKAKV